MPGQTEPWQSYPPEVNAGRIMGPGPATWDAVATGWDEVAKVAQEQLIALGLQGVMLATNWKGSSGMQALGNLIPYGQWLMEMGENAKKNAEKARQVVQSYNSTTSSMVPVPQVSTNRAQAAKAQAEIAAGAGLALLNPFAAMRVQQAQMELAQLESQYASYWQQNAAAMQKYDSELAQATKPLPVKDPPKLASGGASPTHNGSFSRYSAGSYSPTYSGYKAGEYTAKNYAATDYTRPEYVARESAAFTPYTYSSTRADMPTYTAKYGQTSVPSTHTIGSSYATGAQAGTGRNFGGINVAGTNGYASSRATPPGSVASTARNSAGALSRSFGSGNSLGNFRALSSAGGLNPNFRGSVSPSGLSTGGLGLPKAGGTAGSTGAFGGVRPGAAAVSGKPLGSGMGMFPPGAHAAGSRKQNESSSSAADIRDEDSNVLAGISVVQLDYDDVEETVSPAEPPKS